MRCTGRSAARPAGGLKGLGLERGIRTVPDQAPIKVHLFVVLGEGTWGPLTSRFGNIRHVLRLETLIPWVRGC